MTLYDPRLGPPRIIVAAPMKSGSTYVAHTIGRYFNAPDFDPQLDWTTEHNLAPWIEQTRGNGFCFNFHMKPYPSNIMIAQQEGVSITVLWRNLGDMLLSYDEHTVRVGESASMFFVLDPQHYRDLDAHDRHVFLIDTVAPWYLGFYLRWESVGARLHAYEVMLEDARTFFAELIAGLTARLPDFDRLDSVLTVAPTAADRFNVGSFGRSAGAFSDDAKRRLEEKIITHPSRLQLEILLWELPWEVPWLEPRRPLDGRVVRRSDGTALFISRGIAHPIERKAWILGRTGARRTPAAVSDRELADYAIGDPIR